MTLPVVLLVSALVIVSPVNLSALEPHRPTGSILAWTWVRSLTPLINIYAVIFLVGGTVLSGMRFLRSNVFGHRQRAIANALIAVAGILPGIGGTRAKTGFVEALYVGECLGLILIWAGFTVSMRVPRREVAGQFDRRAAISGQDTVPE
jgi:hypothetical protein